MKEIYAVTYQCQCLLVLCKYCATSCLCICVAILGSTDVKHKHYFVRSKLDERYIFRLQRSTLNLESLMYLIECFFSY